MIDLTEMKKMGILGVELKTLEVNGVQVWKSGYTNQVPVSIDVNGNIYNGCGYKNGYRVRSGGAEAAMGAVSCTGFIPVNGGDKVRLSGYDFNASANGLANTINVYNSSFNVLGQIASNYNNAGYGIFTEGGTHQAYCWNSCKESPAGVLNWTVPPDAGIAYIRVTGYTEGDGLKMIVTVNEEIE